MEQQKQDQRNRAFRIGRRLIYLSAVPAVIMFLYLGYFFYLLVHASQTSNRPSMSFFTYSMAFVFICTFLYIAMMNIGKYIQVKYGGNREIVRESHLFASADRRDTELKLTDHEEDSTSPFSKK